MKLEPSVNSAVTGINQVTEMPDESELNKRGAETREMVEHISKYTDGRDGVDQFELKLVRDDAVNAAKKVADVVKEKVAHLGQKESPKVVVADADDDAQEAAKVVVVEDKKKPKKRVVVVDEEDDAPEPKPKVVVVREKDSDCDKPKKILIKNEDSKEEAKEEIMKEVEKAVAKAKKEEPEEKVEKKSAAKELLEKVESVVKPEIHCDCVKRIVDECLDTCQPKTPALEAVEEATKQVKAKEAKATEKERNKEIVEEVEK